MITKVYAYTKHWDFVLVAYTEEVSDNTSGRRLITTHRFQHERWNWRLPVSNWVTSSSGNDMRCYDIDIDSSNLVVCLRYPIIKYSNSNSLK